MKKLICIGDSNTYGYDPRNFMGGRYDHPWPESFQSQTGIQTVNLGQNGMEIPADDFEMELLDWKIQRALPADAMTVMLGTNDLLGAYRPNLESITNHMRDFLCHLHTTYPACQLYLLALPPVKMEERGLSQNAKRLSDRYRALAEELQIPFIDVTAWNVGIAYDCVHLTEEAHHCFAEQLQHALFN